MLANDRDNYGWLSICLHWLMALGIAGLFALGLIMVDLDYYDPWYNRAPHIHESIGLLLAAILLLRLLARSLNPPPPPLESLNSMERALAKAMHWLFYLLMIGIAASGYLISTAGGGEVEVFNWFSVPGLAIGLEQQEDSAGLWHCWIAWSLILLSALHASAAIKHHFIDRDRTLKRILYSPPNNTGGDNT
jgi:cytochrome b561